MDKNKLTKDIAAILPTSPTAMPGLNRAAKIEAINKTADELVKKQSAKELAQIKYKEKQKMRRFEEKRDEALKARQEAAEALGVDIKDIPVSLKPSEVKDYIERSKNMIALEAIEAETVQPLSVENITKQNSGALMPNAIQQAMQLQGTTRPEIAKLLTALNINLSVQLSKTDTANLLACLLTCNESQLQALMTNKKVPVVIKTVIKRMLEDMKLGNIDTVERLWDRIFGKGAMQLNLPEQAQIQTGIIPNTPISREAYVIIRDTLIK